MSVVELPVLPIFQIANQAREKARLSSRSEAFSPAAKRARETIIAGQQTQFEIFIQSRHEESALEIETLAGALEALESLPLLGPGCALFDLAVFDESIAGLIRGVVAGEAV